MNLLRIAARLALTQPLSERPDYGDDSVDKTGKVVKSPGKDEWCVESEKNPDWNGGCYPSKGKAEDRLHQVEYFKHKASAQDVWGEHIRDVVAATSAVEKLATLGLVDAFNADPQVQSLLAKMRDEYVAPMGPLWRQMTSLAASFASRKEE